MKNNNYYIAVDLGAESGRVMVGILEEEKLKMKEIHRFPTKQITENDTIHWDIYFIVSQIKEGIKKASAQGYNQPKGIGVDSWGVDFGLLDENDELIELPVAYRDKRTDGMMEKVFEIIPKENIYKIAGIQFLKFNSIFQLYSLVYYKPEVLEKAKSFLMMPDLVNFFLTGVKHNEYTDTTTTSLMNAQKRELEKMFFDKLNIPFGIMQKIVQPGTKIGEIKTELLSELDLQSTNVFAVGSHDTASAIAAVPAQGNNWAYLSSGTWSLLGIEVSDPILTEQALKYGFTNEGGIEKTIRFLKNIMGLWILQRFRHSWSERGEELNYYEITELARKAEPFQAYFNTDDERYFNPKDMLTELENYFTETNQIVPNGIGEMSRVILENLAFKIAYYLKQISQFKSESIEVLHIVGGGSKNVLLNQFISNVCNVKVIAGPDEGTAAGNIMTQAMANGDIKSLSEIREYIRNSYPIKEYIPQDIDIWKENYKKYIEICTTIR